MSKLLATVLTELHGDNPLKAWSVIITFFGDSVAPRGGAISTTTVQTVMATLGIGPGTVRTAFSRLAKDGWVTRQKVGRNTFYSLSETGQVPFLEAEAVIYAGPSKPTDPKNNSRWLVVTRSPQKSRLDDIYRTGIKLNKDTFLFPKAGTRQIKILSTDQALISTVESSDIPQWVFDQVAPATVRDNYVRLQKKAQEISVHLPDDQLSALAIRTLLIHEWRRILLRSDEPGSLLLPADWPYEACRQSVSTLYQQLSPAAESWLDSEALGPNGSLEKSGVDTLQRFS